MWTQPKSFKSMLYQKNWHIKASKRLDASPACMCLTPQVIPFNWYIMVFVTYVTILLGKAVCVI